MSPTSIRAHSSGGPQPPYPWGSLHQPCIGWLMLMERWGLQKHVLLVEFQWFSPRSRMTLWKMFLLRAQISRHLTQSRSVHSTIAESRRTYLIERNVSRFHWAKRFRQNNCLLSFDSSGWIQSCRFDCRCAYVWAPP